MSFREGCVDAQGSWHHDAAALPAVLGFPGGCFLNFLPRIFVLWYSPEVNNSLSHTFLIGTQFCFGCKQNVVLALNQCSAPSFRSLQRQGGQCSRGLGAGTASPPHPCPLPGAPAWGSTTLHTQTPVFPWELRFLAFLEQQVCCYCAFCSSALLVKFIVVKRPEHTGRERQLPSISSLREV